MRAAFMRDSISSACGNDPSGRAVYANPHCDCRSTVITLFPQLSQLKPFAVKLRNQSKMRIYTALVITLALAGDSRSAQTANESPTLGNGASAPVVLYKVDPIYTEEA